MRRRLTTLFVATFALVAMPSLCVGAETPAAAR
jgi:hypothetical protein